jgi:hypothetical protein
MSVMTSDTLTVVSVMTNEYNYCNECIEYSECSGPSECNACNNVRPPTGQPSNHISIRGSATIFFSSPKRPTRFSDSSSLHGCFFYKNKMDGA